MILRKLKEREHTGVSEAEELLIRYASPTLAGLKVGSLFSASCRSLGALKREICSINEKLCTRGVCVIPLGFSKSRVLVYVYRPILLQKALATRSSRDILSRYGYYGGTCKDFVTELARRISQSNTFPHEIGLFLGYPPEDVLGFIENGARNYKYAGAWKAYGNVENAAKLTETYRRCTDIYTRIHHQGISLECLAVNIKNHERL